MNKKKWLLLLGIPIGLAILSFAAVTLWSYSLTAEVRQKMTNKSFNSLTEIYAQQSKIFPRDRVSLLEVQKMLEQGGFRKRNENETLFPGDFKVDYGCGSQPCLQVFVPLLPWSPQQRFLVSWSEDGQSILKLQSDSGNEVDRLELPPQLFAQFAGLDPVLQLSFSLGQAPTACLNAVVAIEDNHFLQHGGVSWSGILRAALKNLIEGRVAQGGSTITQQLAKNYFLSSERTFRRKFNELILSFVLESQFSKDEILETYLNVIYMGQSGAYQVKGFSSAAQFYFGKKIEALNLSECALLAAIINSPGMYNPFGKKEAALKRRHLVLEKMLANQYITPTQKDEADKQSLPTKSQLSVAETAPYFIEGIKKQLVDLKIQGENLKIYSTLNLEAQSTAQRAVQSHLESLETNHPYIKKMLANKQKLEGAFLVAENSTGEILAAVGGRNFKRSQFNRAFDSRRQVGSIMKPLVFLTDLISDGNSNRPFYVINDEPVSYTENNKKWTPENYEKKYFGNVPLFYALAKSLNSVTVRLILDRTPDKVIETAFGLGIESEIPPYPSIALGANELKFFEVLRAYTTIANFGLNRELSLIKMVLSASGETLYLNEPLEVQTLPAPDVATLVSMLQQTNKWGTARAVANAGLPFASFGKTGTTNDNKDAWYAGGNSNLTALAWVGYDNNTKTTLTGGSGALPIWIQFFKNYRQTAAVDFNWPAAGGLQKANLNELSPEIQSELGQQDVQIYIKE